MSQGDSAPGFSRWIIGEVIALIDLVQQNEAIYNPKNRNYFCRPYVENFWNEVDRKLNKNSGSSLAKWTNLRISFRREFKCYEQEGANPGWVFFEKMMFLQHFLRKKLSRIPIADPKIQEAVDSLNYNTISPAQPDCKDSIGAQPDCKDSIEICSSSSSEVADTPDNFALDDLIEEDHWHDNTTNHDQLTNSIMKVESPDYNHLIVETVDTEDSQSPKANIGGKRTFPPTEHNDDTAGRSLLIKNPRHDNISFVRPLSNHDNSLSERTSIFTMDSISSNEQQHIFTNRQELCVCKTDPDAMFLMSILPDIQSLNRRDKGKIKISIQKIIQDFLYPD